MDFIGPVLFLGVVFDVVVCGLIFGLYIAAQKNRSGTEGFFFGAVLGPIGLIILACLPTMTADDWKRIEAKRYAANVRSGAVLPPSPIPTTVGASRAADVPPPVPVPSTSVRVPTAAASSAAPTNDGRYGSADWAEFQASRSRKS